MEDRRFVVHIAMMGANAVTPSTTFMRDRLRSTIQVVLVVNRTPNI